MLAAWPASPDGVDYADAAAFGVTNRTAYYTLRTVAPPVKPGDWVVVLGAGGGGSAWPPSTSQFCSAPR